ncbi:hypothetical protein [Shewanella sp. WPAGA9]|uniref:hypothetical protein n=1 Tax=Shewanella sp. ENK2 TaxID=2775245 RepID=UPI0017863FF5|nr:hypothetical protein [Shewanella sp. WPAGA9]
MNKVTYCLVTLLCSLLLLGCNSSDDKTALTSIDINQTETLTVELNEVDAEYGKVNISLKGDNNLPVTGAHNFNLLFLGYLYNNPSKYQLQSHEALQVKCINTTECLMNIEEQKDGRYELVADDVNWDARTYKYKVAVEVLGDKSHFEYAFLNVQ